MENEFGARVADSTTERCITLRPEPVDRAFRQSRPLNAAAIRQLSDAIERYLIRLACSCPFTDNVTSSKPPQARPNPKPKKSNLRQRTTAKRVAFAQTDEIYEIPQEGHGWRTGPRQPSSRLLEPISWPTAEADQVQLARCRTLIIRDEDFAWAEIESLGEIDVEEDGSRCRFRAGDDKCEESRVPCTPISRLRRSYTKLRWSYTKLRRSYTKLRRRLAR